MKMKLAVAVMLVSSIAFAAKEKPTQLSNDKTFYIYQDKGSKGNHYIPSGYMGNFSDIRQDESSTVDPIDGRNCIKITVSPKNSQGAGWFGVYWQNLPNNWATKNGGYDLTGFKRLTFWAKAEKENITINEFKVGGMTGEFGDSDSANIGPILLTSDWKKYTIELGDKNLSHIGGGFAWATDLAGFPETGGSFYLDEIRFEK